MVKQKKSSKIGRPAKYPWEKWLKRKGRLVTLKQGVDFTCEPYVMAQQVRNHYNRHSKTCSVRVRENSVVFFSGTK